MNAPASAAEVPRFPTMQGGDIFRHGVRDNAPRGHPVNSDRSDTVCRKGLAPSTRVEPGVPSTRDFRVMGWEPAATGARHRHQEKLHSKRFRAKRQQKRTPRIAICKHAAPGSSLENKISNVIPNPVNEPALSSAGE